MAPKAPLRVLCIDVEGGFGGSSRSLFYSLKHMRPRAISAEVWCRKSGPIIGAYSKIGIVSKHEPRIVSATAIVRPSRTLVDVMRAATALLRDVRALRDWGREIDSRFDLVHFNHEGLLILAMGLRRYCRLPFTFHIRRVAPRHILARWQLAGIAHVASHAVCISESEAKAYRDFGSAENCSVITNIVEACDSEVMADPEILALPGIRVASMANYSWARGIDQLVDVACELKKRGRADFRFIVMGNADFVPSLPNEKQRFGRRPTSVGAFARDAGVADMFYFIGSVPDPAPILAACHMLAKPARLDIPWGRDVLEAMAAGKPVITTGTVEDFVENGVTGVLMPQFDAARFAQVLIELGSDEKRRSVLGDSAKRRVRMLCDPRTQADMLLQAWNAVAQHCQRRRVS